VFCSDVVVFLHYDIVSDVLTAISCALQVSHPDGPVVMTTTMVIAKWMKMTCAISKTKTSFLEFPPSSDDIIPPTWAPSALLESYARFLADLPDWIGISQVSTPRHWMHYQCSRLALLLLEYRCNKQYRQAFPLFELPHSNINANIVSDIIPICGSDIRHDVVVGYV
jgi:hypothetical protein